MLINSTHPTQVAIRNNDLHIFNIYNIVQCGIFSEYYLNSNENKQQHTAQFAYTCNTNRIKLPLSQT